MIIKMSLIMRKLFVILVSCLIAVAPALSQNSASRIPTNPRTQSSTRSNVRGIDPKRSQVPALNDLSGGRRRVVCGDKSWVVYSSPQESRRIQPSQGRAVRYYINTAGERVQSPTYYPSVPAGATARCADGTYSFSKNRRGTCSHHGGVARWL